MENDSFETMLLRLEEIVAAMEKGDLSLDDTIALFQRGIDCSKKCSELLRNAELKIKELKIGDEGRSVLEEVDEENL